MNPNERNAMRESQLKGRLRLRHLLEVTEAVGEQMDNERARFEGLDQDDAKPRAVSSFNLFQTPEPLADQVARMLPLTGRILEPSAGLGRLYRAIRKISDCPLTLVEISLDCCRELYREIEADPYATLVQDDFLQCDVARIGTFDGILMNPPFKQGRDIKHIEHALTFLNPGGTLVSLCANGPRQQKRFRDIADEYHELPAGSFKESYTNVSAAIVVFRR
jgi:predicted RNA methylase